MLRSHVILAVFRRNVASYFSGALGYLFIIVFVVAGSLLAFKSEFFAANQCNLDQLSAWFPLLLVFIVPAITMTAWADERKLGTDELLFTLPATDVEILLGKYLAVLAVYTVALGFSLTHAMVLSYIGEPDPWQLMTTYFGYWIAGAALVSAGLFASVLTNSATVAFILGAGICAVPVGLDLIPGLPDWLRALTVGEQLRDFTLGVIPISGLLYFISLTGFMLYLNVVLVGRRHWAGGTEAPPVWIDAAAWAVVLAAFALIWYTWPGNGTLFFTSLCVAAGVTVYTLFTLFLGPLPGRHFAFRVACLAAALISVNYMASKAAGRIDMTQEQLFTLSDTTYEVLEGVDSESPVTILAYLSPQVPEEYVPVHRKLTGLLRQFDSAGGSAVEVQVKFIEPSSVEAEEASLAGIVGREVQSERGGKITVEEIFLGAVIQGPYEEVVVPFFDVGTSVEYELTRSIGSVTNAERATVGILMTDAKVGGGFDMQTFRQLPEWRIVQELKKQYEVIEVSADVPIVADEFDVLLAILPSSLTEPQMENFLDHVKTGEPVLIFDDPVPVFGRGMGFQFAPLRPKPPQGGGMMGQQMPSDPKADGGRLTQLMDLLDCRWEKNTPDDPGPAGVDFVVFDAFNPHPEFADVVQPELIFISPKSGNSKAFNPDSPVTSGLQELMAWFSGTIQMRENNDYIYENLLTTGGKLSGLLDWDDITQQQPFFGGVQINNNPRRVTDPSNHAIAARIRSKEDASQPLDVIFVADVDIVSDDLFRIQESQFLGLQIDNVTFVLNAVDELAGETEYIELRKRREQLRTLTYVEEQKEDFKLSLNEQIEDAEEQAQDRLDAAQERLDNAVKRIDEDESLDPRTKEQLKRVEQQRAQDAFDAERREIEREKAAEIERRRDQTNRKIREIERSVWLMGVVLPPIPAILLMVIVLSIRVMNEVSGVSPDRLVKR